MKKLMFLVGLFFISILIAPVTSHAIGFEVAIGGWNQSPQGDFSYKLVPGDDSIDLEKDLNYDDYIGFTGRLKVDMPLILPNIYLMTTSSQFDGEGSKAITFGGISFPATVPIDSELTLNNYDIAIYYGVPFVSTASLGMFNVDAGINVRVYDFKAKIIGQTILGITAEESVSLSVPVPMLFLAAQVKPIDMFAVEAEARVISYDDNQVYSLIGRLKVKVFGPLFAAGGYRYDRIKLDSEDVEADITLSGLFVEAGFAF
ncbi:MAG: TIGR04219 family outer membrane beta-barrel protein [Desulfobacteraceae bacterium]|nr:MAG: TIGR04219 family outer membrane beta-barrel protein [Desulfobacteraceae bacterium]